MSYAAVGTAAAMGAYDPSICMKLYVDYSGTQIPDALCPGPTGQTGHHPPRPRPCSLNASGGIGALQTALLLAGRNPGPVDHRWGTMTAAALASVASDHNISWSGDPFAIPPALCAAVISEASSAAACPSTDLKVGCVLPPTGPAPSPAPAPAPAPSPSPTRIKPSAALLTTALRPGGESAPQQIKPSLATRLPSPAGPATTQVPTQEPVGEGIPTWMLVAGGVAILGGVYLAFGRRR